MLQAGQKLIPVFDTDVMDMVMARKRFSISWEQILVFSKICTVCMRSLLSRFTISMSHLKNRFFADNTFWSKMTKNH